MELGPRDRTVVVDVDVAVQVVPWTKSLKEPAKDLEATMAEIRLVVDVARRSMRHQDVQVAAVAHAIPEQSRQHVSHLLAHPELRELVRAPVVAHAAVE